MTRKLALLAFAVAALAVPASANASTGITMPLGTYVPVGTLVTGTNSGTVTVTDPRIGNITCSAMMIEVQVTKNSAALGFEGQGVGSGTASGCLNNGHSITLTNIVVSKIESTASESEKAKVSLSFTVNLPELTCKFSGTNLAATYTAGTSGLKLEKGALTVSPAACGSGEIDAAFSLETTSGGGSIIIM